MQPYFIKVLNEESPTAGSLETYASEPYLAIGECKMKFSDEGIVDVLLIRSDEGFHVNIEAYLSSSFISYENRTEEQFFQDNSLNCVAIRKSDVTKWTNREASRSLDIL